MSHRSQTVAHHIEAWLRDRGIPYTEVTYREDTSIDVVTTAEMSIEEIRTVVYMGLEQGIKVNLKVFK